MKRRSLLTLGCAAALSGCSTVHDVAALIASQTADALSATPSDPTYLDWKGLLLVTDPDANDNTPIAFDIVFVRNRQALDRLRKLDAHAWFRARAEQQATYPGAMVVRSFELVPGQTLRLSESELDAPRVVGVLLYADYPDPGAHRITLPRSAPGAIVRFGLRDFTVTTYRFGSPT